MKIFENYNNAKQKYGEQLAKQALDIGIPNQFISSACRFNKENGTPFETLRNMFSQWMMYVDYKHIDVNNIDYGTFWNTLVKYKREALNKGEIYNNGVVSIREISDYEDMQKLPFANLWCIRKKKGWDEYKGKEPPAMFCLVTNKNYSEESNCRYVMVEMYSNGEIGYWSTNNELIDEECSTRRLPKLSEYQQSLGEALQKIQEIQKAVMNNNKKNLNCNINKKLIRLTESDLYRVIKEVVNTVLMVR